MFTAPSKMPQQYPRSGLFPPIFDQDVQSGSDDDVTLNGLKEIVSRQQKEIENHQQQLVAKEQRLKFLKSPNIMENNDEAVRMMQDKVQAQEQKLERLREIQGQVDQQKLSNVSELDNVKALFEDKERELASAVAKVDSLSKQLDSLKKSQITKMKGDSISISTDELEKLKRDLKMKSEMNEQKNRELAIQLDILNKRNKHVDYLDQRIEELQLRLKKKRAAMEQNQIILGPHRNKNPNIATVEPSIRQEPVIQKDDELKKVPSFPSSQDSRYQTLPLGFKFTPAASTDGQPNAYTDNREHEKMSGPVDDMKPRSSPDLHKQAQQIPVKSEASIAIRPMQSGAASVFTSSVQPAMKFGQQLNYPSQESEQTTQRQHQKPVHPPSSRPHVPLSVYSNDPNNNRRNSPDYTKEKPDGQQTLRPNTSSAPVVAPYKPMYASRSVIADTYMKRLGPRPMYAATKPHSIPNFHPQNSIISDKVSSKNNTLRSLRRRHSYTETDEAKIEQALGPREVTPGAAETPPSPTNVEPPKPSEPEPEVAEPEPAPSPIPEENTSWEEPNRVPNSGIVARQILKKELGVKRNHTRRVCFDPHALLLDASLEGEYDLVKRSASEVKDPSQPNDEGITALHNAICAGHLDIVKFLVKFGVDINSQDVDGWTPLHCSASCNNLAMTKLLVEHGACIYATTFSDHETPAEKCEEDDDGYDGCSQYLYGIQEKLGVLNQGAVYALYNYQPARDDELAFNNGEKMTIVRKNDENETDWWWARIGDKEGYIPRTFVGLFPRVTTPV